MAIAGLIGIKLIAVYRGLEMASRILIAGIGNDLMGDDALGPVMVARLSELFQMPSEVELRDVGLAGFDLLEFMRGRDAVILVDVLDQAEHTPGHVLRYAKADLLRDAKSFRLSPHEQSLGQTLLAADLLGCGAADVVLIGAVGMVYEMGCGLSDDVRIALPRVEAAVIEELRRLGVEVRRRSA